MKVEFVLITLVIGLALLCGCTQQGSTGPAATSTPTPVAMVTPVPTIVAATPTTVIPTPTVTAEMTTPAPTPTTAMVTTAMIIAEGNAFRPTPLTISPGTKVTWVNNDAVIIRIICQSIPGRSDYGTLNSGTIRLGMSYSYTFNDEGTYAYYNSFNPSMKGTIIVKAQTT